MNEPSEKHSAEKVEVCVQYVGNADYVAEYPAAASIQDVKVHAMKHFGIELSAAKKYVLQFSGADLKENAHLGSLGGGKIVLMLSLITEPVKG